MSRERGSSGDLPRGRAQTRPEVVCRRRSAPQPPRGPPPTRPPAETRPGPLLGPSVPSFADGRPPRPPRGHAHGRSWVPALWSRLWVPALRPHTGGDPPQGAATTASRPRRKRKRGGGDLDTGGGGSSSGARRGGRCREVSHREPTHGGISGVAAMCARSRGRERGGWVKCLFAYKWVRVRGNKNNWLEVRGYMRVGRKIESSKLDKRSSYGWIRGQI